jgi:hypothetical protein
VDTLIMLLGTLIPVLAASLFYVGDHREAQRARVPVRHEPDQW